MGVSMVKRVEMSSPACMRFLTSVPLVLDQSPECLDGKSFLGYVNTGLLLGRR